MIQPTKPIRCFIFDLDGTLVFNEKANFEAYKITFKQLGMGLTEQEFKQYWGGTIDDFLQIHAKKYNVPYSHDLLAQAKKIKAKEYAKLAPQIEQNHAIVGLLKALAPHYHTALATTARETNARVVLDVFGLNDLFDYMVFGEDVKNKKPDPECHHKIAKHFNVTPDECLIFEDSSSGLKAAEAFGAHVCKVVR